MTLFRQLIIAVVILFICLYAGNTMFTLHNNRLLVEDQMEVHAQDTATSLALSMTQAAQDKDIATMDTMFNAVSDSGYYQRIYFTDLEQNIVIDREFPISIETVPNWFVAMMSLPSPEGRAEVSSGWSQMGVLTVISHPGQAYSKLWKVTTTQLGWFAGITLLVSLLAFFALKWLLAPLTRVEQQANEIYEKRFVTQDKIPKTRELGRVVLAMNRMADHLKEVFDDQLAVIGQLQKQSFRDAVTGLSNRSDFDNRLSSFVDDKEAGAHTGALIIIAMQDIAAVNEFAGRGEGNNLLKAIGECLTNAVLANPRAVVARRQGQEFTVFLPDVTSQEGEELAGTLFNAVQGVNWLHHDKCPLYFHMGYTYHSEVTSGGDMLGEADIALKQAKLQGTNHWAKLSDVQDVEVPVLGRTLQEWQDYLEQTIKGHQIVPHYQPVLSVSDNEIVAHKVFVRFLNGDELLTAAAVLPIAERLGLMPQLDQLILESLASTNREQVFTCKLCVNLSKISVQTKSFMAWLESFLVIQRELASKLIFEVSEFGEKVDEQSTRQLVDLTQKCSASLAIDGFGLKSSAFGYLGSLPLHHIKVHRSFLRELDQNPDNQFYIRSLVQLAHSRDVQLWLEGVESELEWKQLAELGVDAAQGYFLGKPQSKPVE
ncbi:MAG: EAL domain-containing protein [Porticoccus sp.]|nr:EAL domain-containing protein [Porticoccus sp.]MBQ0807539.1 EAL domain-containing protein [Porticoccus sp.]